MRSFYTFISTIFICIFSNAQTGLTNPLPYEYDTTLKGGYTISFKVDDTLQYLYLKKDTSIIVELASTARGFPYKSLGYVSADFKEYFVLTHSFGSGNPHHIELIKKSTGENTLKDRAAWIDASEEKELLLYCDNDVPDKKDKMILLNLNTGKRQFFSFPSDIFEGPEVLNRIQISELTNKQLVLKYTTKKGEKTKIYRL